MFKTGETYLQGRTETFKVYFRPEKQRNPYLCVFDTLKLRGYGKTAHDAIEDAHRKLYEKYPQLLRMLT